MFFPIQNNVNLECGSMDVIQSDLLTVLYAYACTYLRNKFENWLDKHFFDH